MPGMTTTTTTSTALNNYFVPGYGISRAVIQSEIRYHCGPDAIVRPFTHQVRDHINYCSTCCMMLHPPAQLTLPACPGPRWIPRHHQRSFIDKSIRPSKSGSQSLPLTHLYQAQIEDIKIASKEYEERHAQRTSEDEGEPFVNKPIPVSPRGRKPDMVEK